MFVSLLLFASKGIFTKNQFKPNTKMLSKNDSSNDIVECLEPLKSLKGCDMTKPPDQIMTLEWITTTKQNFAKLEALNYLQIQDISLNEKLLYIENSQLFEKPSMRSNISSGSLFKEWRADLEFEV
jgi:hypothetical protein